MKKSKEEDTPINPEYTSAETSFKREELITTAQPLIKKAFFATWMVVDFLLIGFFLASIVYYLLVGTFVEKRQISTIGNNILVQNNIGASRAAVDLDVDTARQFALGDSKYDFYAEITNSNADWYATFEYYFETAIGETDLIEGFILPEETRLLVAFNQEMTTRPSGPDLIIQNLKWSRVDRHQIPDIGSWLYDHIQIEVSDATYGFEIEIDNQSIARSSFTVENKSQYSYWNPTFLVTLSRGGTIVGINQVVIPGFESGETREVDVNWFSGAPTSGTVNVIPQINFFDETEYLDISIDAIDDVRDRFQ